MKKEKPIELLFAATSDFLPYAIVTALSAIDHVKGRFVNIHFMYADIVKKISDNERKSYFDCAINTLMHKNAKIFFYDITDNISMLDGQNTGMWGKEISLTHYFYLLAQDVLPKNINKVIYLDTDMIVNCDLSDVFDIKMGNKLIAMGAPHGFEIFSDMSNSGFCVLNLKLWRKEKTLDSLLKFGRNLPRIDLCDQHLLYQYFTKRNHDRLLLLEKEYNIFPQCFPDMNLDDIKILHYAGLEFDKPFTKPWKDPEKFRAEYWWYYARKTAFYEMFLHKMIVTSMSAHQPIAVEKKRKHHSFWWHLLHMKF